MSTNLPAKIPTAWAAQTLARICDEIDNAPGDIDAFLQKAFEDAHLDLSDAVDRRIAFDRWVKIQVQAAEEGYRYYRDRKAQLETVHARFKEKTKAIMEATPDLVDAFRGKLGKISLCASPPAVEFNFGGKDVTPDVAEFFGVPAEYVLSKTTYYVDAPRVKTELQAGQTLEWATLRTSSHIRFPAAPRSKQIEGEGK